MKFLYFCIRQCINVRSEDTICSSTQVSDGMSFSSTQVSDGMSFSSTQVSDDINNELLKILCKMWISYWWQELKWVKVVEDKIFLETKLQIKDCNYPVIR